MVLPMRLFVSIVIVMWGMGVIILKKKRKYDKLQTICAFWIIGWSSDIVWKIIDIISTAEGVIK